MKKKLMIESDLRPKPQDDPKHCVAPLTQKQVAKALGMSAREVRQAEARALEKLRRHLLRRKI